MIPTVALPPKARATLYIVFSLLGLGLGGTQVGYAAASAGQPVWLIVALAVFAFLGTGLGLTAASNTKTGEQSAAVPDELADQPVIDGGNRVLDD